MGDWAAIALRFGIYLDLMLLFGLAAYPLYGARPATAGGQRAILATLAILGFVLSTAGFAQVTADMAGVTVGELDRETLRFIVQDTVPGSAFLVRTTALVAVFVLALAARGALAAWLMGVAAVAALATLAWTGHAAVSEGLPGTFHRLSDIVHLLAASAWIGALAILLKALVSANEHNEAVTNARHALTVFALTGTVLVALIVVTGVINGWMIVGLAGLPLLPSTLYGQLLIAKLLLFGIMLGFAAANRWQLTPRLVAAREEGETARAVSAVRTSIAFEASMATVILALVAWLGTLAPPSPI